MTTSAFSLLSREKAAQADHPGRIWMSLTPVGTPDQRSGGEKLSPSQVNR